ncbi:type IV secretion system DNA-binding domain-containing protein [Erythrobacter aureus]|uniref:type IV secretion system DNA-binding domain-containing protein n=1 Tax=Erythrobacter aureus TaxID=2182384 RepID=UPI003A8F59EA
MKTSLVNFTRGSQLLGHFGFMFAAGLKGPLIVAIVLVLALTWWEVSGALDDYQTYLLWMHIYASGYTFMEFDREKLVNLRMPDGDMVAFPISVITQYPPMREAWAAFSASLQDAMWLSLAILLPLFLMFWWVAEHFGERSKRKRHVRGASLATLSELEADIAHHNKQERAREYGTEIGWKWRLAGSSALQGAGLYAPAHLAGISWPWRREQSHTMLVGTTGTGKTVALFELVKEIRERRERAVIFDLTGAFIESFYEPERDIILNPLDERCPAWSVFDDCTSRAEFHAAAESLVPHDGGGAEQFWVLAARTMFVETCLKLAEEGRGSNAALASDLMNADLSDLHKMLEDTMAGPITTPSAAKMAESVRAVFNVNAKAMQMLPSQGDAFSIRKWIKGDCAEGSLLFLSARYVDMSVLSQMLTLWLDTAINTLMTGRRTRDLKLWFLVDELGALHRLPSLEKGLQTARNFGGAIVTGIHTYAKLKEVYGENLAMTLSSLARTKLILATADRETATWCSDIVGHREVREMEEGYSYGYNNARDAVSLTPRRQVVPLLLPDEFMGLPSLAGYIKFPDGFPAAPVTLVPRDWPRIAEGFIERDLSAVAPDPVEADYAGSANENGSSDDEGAAGEDEDGGKRAAKKRRKPPAVKRTRTAEKIPSQRHGERDTTRDQKQDRRAPGETQPTRNKQIGDRARVPDRDAPMQSELPLDRESDRPQSGSPDLSLSRKDAPDPEKAMAQDNDRNREAAKRQEEHQRGLLGGAAREHEERDVGDIEPDI